MKSWTHFRDVLPVANRVSMQRDPKIELNYRWSLLAHHEDFEMKQAEDGNAAEEVVEGSFDYYVITRGNQGWELVQMMESEREHTFIWKRDSSMYYSFMQQYWQKEAYDESKAEAEAFKMPPMFPSDDE